MNREQSLKLYYENPNHCKVIEVLDNQRVADVRKKQFCSHSCAASYNNRGRIKHDENKICPRCGKPKHKDSEMCRSCWEELNGIGNKTLGYYTSGQNHLNVKK